MDYVLWTRWNITTFVLIATTIFIYDTEISFVAGLQQTGAYTEPSFGYLLQGN